MRLSSALFSLCMLFCLAGPMRAQSVEGQTDSTATKICYEKRMERRARICRSLMPKHFKVQFAGSIGVMSFGTGWTYGKKQQGETDIMVGFLPKFESDHNKAVFTLKQSYLPWKIRIKQSQWAIQPFSCSLFLSCITGDDFWTNEPDRYPSGYYGFASRIRVNLSMGQRVVFDMPNPTKWWVQRVALYYELGACDTDICTFFGDRTIKLRQILSLAIGMKIEF